MNTKTLAKDFFENRNVCGDPVELALNEECYVVDQNIVDEENDRYGIIPCVVVRIDQSSRIPGRKYYALRAYESINDEQLNSIEEAGVKYYRYLENTSPFIIKINNVIDK